MVSYPSFGPAPSWISSYSSFCSAWISFFCSCSFYRFSLSWAWRISCSTSPSPELSPCLYNWVWGTAPSCRKWRHSVNHQKRVINTCCSLQGKIWHVVSIRKVLYFIFSIIALWSTKKHTQTLVKTWWHLYSKNYSLSFCVSKKILIGREANVYQFEGNGLRSTPVNRVRFQLLKMSTYQTCTRDARIPCGRHIRVPRCGIPPYYARTIFTICKTNTWIYNMNIWAYEVLLSCWAN